MFLDTFSYEKVKQSVNRYLVPQLFQSKELLDTMRFFELLVDAPFFISECQW